MIEPALGEIMADRAVCVASVEEAFWKSLIRSPRPRSAPEGPSGELLVAGPTGEFLAPYGFHTLKLSFWIGPHPIDIDSKRQ